MIRRWLEIDGQLTLLQITWLFAPIAVWFSYQPLLRLGQNATMHFELSLTLVYITILALVGLPSVWRARKQLIRNKVTYVVVAFCAMALLSTLWTENVVRGLLTSGVMGALILIFLAAVAEVRKIKHIVPALAKLFVMSASVMAIFAIVQFFAGIWFVRDETLLCAGCVAQQLGFVRPNVFTIEPQFLGSLFIVPALIMFRYVLIKPRNILVLAVLLLITVALFLTLSRGAIFAFGAGIILLLAIHYRQVQRGIIGSFLLVAALAISVTLQGIAASISPKVTDTFAGAVSSSIDQLSLGLIDIPVDDGPVGAEQPKFPQDNTKPAGPRFDGYIAESTTTRLELSKLAIQTWTDSPGSIVAGTGLGSAGVAINEMFPRQIHTREIVQNEYIEILLETGIIGLALFIGMLGGLFYMTRDTKWLWALIIPFLLQWNFFSGYPNALHIYLIFIIMVVATVHRGRSELATRY